MSLPLLWYTTRATGLAALVLLTLTVVLGIATANRFSTRSWPRFAQQDLHKRISAVTLVFLAVHVLTSVIDTYVDIGWAAAVVPFTSPYDRFWVAVGTIGADLMLAVAVSSVIRQRISARTWRALHWLAYLSWPVALAHAFGMGTDMAQKWAIGLGAGCILAVLVSACWRVGARVRLTRPASRKASVKGTVNPAAVGSQAR